MNTMKILDCTLRDGGYYTNWDFDQQLVETYFNSINKLPIEYVEIGYRSPKLSGYHGEFFYCPSLLLNDIAKITTKKLVIILNEKDINSSNIHALLDPCRGIVTMIRLAINPTNITRAIKIAELIKSMGFEVGFNVMYMSTWKENPVFLNELKNVDGIANYFYMVDSYGGVYPDDVKDIYSIVRSAMNCEIGFHGHNNLELALINSLTAFECGATIIDSTITGMGRGAGNLKTELLLTALNQKDGLEIDFNALSTVTDAFTDLQRTYEWGTNLPYMVSGANSLPQKEVMEWVSKRYYSINSIIRALYNQRNNHLEDSKYQIFTPNNSYDTILIIGGGESVQQHSKAILKFLENNRSICIIHASSRNAGIFKDCPNKQYFSLVGNEGVRLEKTFNDIDQFNGECVLPPSPRKMGTYVPQKLIQKVSEHKEKYFKVIEEDSHTSIALQTAIELSPEKCFIAGYDGYNLKSLDSKEQELFIENDLLFNEFSKCNSPIISITPSKYKNLVIESVYEKI